MGDLIARVSQLRGDVVKTFVPSAYQYIMELNELISIDLSVILISSRTRRYSVGVTHDH